MSLDLEENPRNPELAKYKVKASLNHFLIKYANEDERKFLADLVVKVIQKHELTDFHVEEQKAYLDTRILYNFVTIVRGVNFSFEDLDREFMKKYV